MNREQVMNLVKAAFVFGCAAIAYKVIMPTQRKSNKKGELAVVELGILDRPKIAIPPFMDEIQAQANPKSAQAHLALSVYIDGLNSGASNEELDKINLELKTDLGMKVYRRRSDDNIVVADLDGKDIMEYDAPAAIVA